MITAAGIAGVIAFSVNQRTQEFGVRMALGARRADVLGMVLAQGLRLVLTGLAIAVGVGSLLSGRVAIGLLLAWQFILTPLLLGTGKLDPLLVAAALRRIEPGSASVSTSSGVALLTIRRRPVGNGLTSREREVAALGQIALAHDV